MKSKKLSIPYILWMLVFTMIPIVMIGVTAFKNKQAASPWSRLPRHSATQTSL